MLTGEKIIADVPGEAPVSVLGLHRENQRPNGHILSEHGGQRAHKGRWEVLDIHDSYVHVRRGVEGAILECLVHWKHFL